MLFKTSKDLTLVVYDDFKNAKCFQFSKKQLKFFLTAVPVIVLVSVSVVTAVLLYGQQIIQRIKSSQPEIITQLNDEKKELADEMARVTALNEELVQKLSLAGDTGGEASSHQVFLFKAPAGMQDLTEKSPIKISDIRHEITENEIGLEFNIGHNEEFSTYSKMSGYILVFFKSGSLLSVYPRFGNSLDSALTTFNAGEPFAFKRLRPVKAIFPKFSQLAESLSFKIMIFSKSGDLLQKHVATFKSM